MTAKEMKEKYTILIPNMLPVHFSLIQNVFELYGYRVELLKNEGRAVVDTGLEYVHNDTCYPALLCIGQMIDALKSGKYDLEHVALMITQTGGGCRASNYIHLLRKALARAGMAQIPVISLNISGLEKDSSFPLTLRMLVKALYMLIYGDLIMLLSNQVAPYEDHPGDADRLTAEWTKKLTDQFRAASGGFSPLQFRRNLHAIVADYEAIPVTQKNLIHVGVVGEIYVKYSSLANNHLEDFLRGQGCEVMVPGLMNFIAFKVDNRIEDIGLYGGSRVKKQVLQLTMKVFEKIESAMQEALRGSRFVAPATYAHLKKLLGEAEIIGYGCKMGEGWLLTAEMLELIEAGYENVICAQPFGCLPNHIVGKGMIRRLRELYPQANIVPIDYDPGATRVNQENRIKLMLAVAAERGMAKTAN